MSWRLLGKEREMYLRLIRHMKRQEDGAYLINEQKFGCAKRKLCIVELKGELWKNRLGQLKFRFFT